MRWLIIHRFQQKKAIKRPSFWQSEIHHQKGNDMIKIVFWLLTPLLVYGNEVGGFSVKRELTSSKLLFPDKVVVHAFDDPKVQGVTCYLSGIETGGVKGAVGLAEDPNQISISCKQTGTIVLGAIDKSNEGEVVFSEKQ